MSLIMDGLNFAAALLCSLMFFSPSPLTLCPRLVISGLVTSESSTERGHSLHIATVSIPVLVHLPSRTSAMYSRTLSARSLATAWWTGWWRMLVLVSSGLFWGWRPCVGSRYALRSRQWLGCLSCCVSASRDFPTRPLHAACPSTWRIFSGRETRHLP